ncbi:MAG TPA: hypothetical protein VFN03_11985, partial [Trueperaceae bacterium]|nr:hypothetical protein [Trueperaceae bacterium]
DAAHPNLVIATGHAMMGVSLAPITGRLVADMVAGRASELDVTALDPRRHQRGGPHVGARRASA